MGARRARLVMGARSASERMPVPLNSHEFRYAKIARAFAVALVFLSFAAQIHAQRGAEKPPAADRPLNFSGLVGVFRISTSASPTEVAVEDPLILTVRISGEPDRTFKTPEPVRANLRLFTQQMKDDFFIEPVPEKDRHLEKEKVWEFVYRLRPKHMAVKSIPGLKLAYYLPARRKYQSSRADEIELVVKPRPEAPPTKEAIEAARLPARFYELATGPAVLRRPVDRSWLVPTMIALFLLPPAVCFLWYRRWRRLHPDARQQVQQRRSQAAQHALRLLHKEPRPDEEQTFALLAAYLRQRFDFAVVEPTAREVAEHLNRIGISRGLRNRIADFIGTCDAARFTPAAENNNNRLPEEAGQLIHALEAETHRAAKLIPAVRSSHGNQPRRSPMVPMAIVLLLWGGTSFAHKGGHEPIPEAELLRQAEADFHKGTEAAEKPAEARKQFAAAAHHFDELRKRGVLNPDLFRNLGNSEMLAGNLGGAVFAYRRGLLLSPNDGDLRANLEYARSRVRYASSSRPPKSMWLPPALVVLLATFVFYTLACIALTRRLIKGRGTWRVVAFSVAAILASAAFAWLEWDAWQEQQYPLVVIAKDGVPFYRGNGESYPTHATLPNLNAGMETRRLYQRGSWLHIQLPGGEVGWVNRDAVFVE